MPRKIKKMIYLVFIIVFWIPRALFYLNIPIVGINGDTFDYTGIAFFFSKGQIPDLGIIPPLYPIFFAISSSFVNSLSSIIFIQTLFTFFCFLYLLRSFLINSKKFIESKGIQYFIIFAIVLTSLDSHLLLLETDLMTESLQFPLLLLFIGSIVNTYFNRSKFNFIFIVSIVFLIAFNRSNGLILYPVLLCFIGYLFIRFKTERKIILVFTIAPLILLNFMWSLLNYSSTDTFFFGNPYRMKTVVQTNIVNPQNIAPEKIESSTIYNYKKYNYDFLKYDYIKEPNSKPLLIINYLFDIQESRDPFFSKMILSRYNDYYVNNKFADTSFYHVKFLKYEAQYRDDIRQYSLKDYANQKVDQSPIELGFVSILFDKINFLNNLLTRNLVFHLVNLLGIIYLWILVIRKKAQLNALIVIVTMLSMAAYGNLVGISLFHGRLLSRYHYIFNLFHIINAILNIDFLITKFSRKKNA